MRRDVAYALRSSARDQPYMRGHLQDSLRNLSTSDEADTSIHELGRLREIEIGFCIILQKEIVRDQNEITGGYVTLN